MTETATSTPPIAEAAEVSPSLNNEAERRRGVTRDTASVSPMTPLEETTVDNVSDFRKDSSRWERQQETFRKQVGRASLEQLAADWHVSPAALDALGIGFDRYAYTFPMCNAAGQVVGLHLRPKKGGKTNAPGSTLGLFLPSLPLQSRTLSTPLSTRGVTHDTLTVSPVIRRVVPFGDLQLVVEGVSDAAAALSLGFTAVGTPGAGTCGEMVVELFARRANACPCVVGDNDDAGVMGAERLREALLAARVPCRVLFPPAGFKDLRAWFVGGLTTGELQSAIEAAPVRYPRKWPAGFSMVPHALVRRGLIRQVGQTAFAVLMAIADFQDSRGRARPTRKQLAELVGISLASVARALHELREAGVLRWRSGRTNRANEYTLGLGPCAGAKKRYAAAPTWSGNGEGAALAKGELA